MHVGGWMPPASGVVGNPARQVRRSPKASSALAASSAASARGLAPRVSVAGGLSLAMADQLARRPAGWRSRRSAARRWPMRTSPQQGGRVDEPSSRTVRQRGDQPGRARRGGLDEASVRRRARGRAQAAAHSGPRPGPPAPAAASTPSTCSALRSRRRGPARTTCRLRADRAGAARGAEPSRTASRPRRRCWRARPWPRSRRIVVRRSPAGARPAPPKTHRQHPARRRLPTRRWRRPRSAFARRRRLERWARRWLGEAGRPRARRRDRSDTPHISPASRVAGRPQPRRRARPALALRSGRRRPRPPRPRRRRARRMALVHDGCTPRSALAAAAARRARRRGARHGRATASAPSAASATPAAGVALRPGASGASALSARPDRASRPARRRDQLAVARLTSSRPASASDRGQCYAASWRRWSSRCARASSTFTIWPAPTGRELGRARRPGAGRRARTCLPGRRGAGPGRRLARGRPPLISLGGRLLTGARPAASRQLSAGAPSRRRRYRRG